MSVTVDERQTPAVVVEPGPIRMCVGCRSRHAQSTMLRFGLRFGLRVGHGDQQPAQVAPTLGARHALGGRSAYLCPRRECLDRAVKRRVFTRALTTGSTNGRAGRGGKSIGSGSGSGSGESIESVGPAAADALWIASIDILRREIDLLGRCTENTHVHFRRRGLERLLFELSSQPAPSDGRSSMNRQGGTPTHG